MYYTYYISKIGDITLVSDGKYLTHLYLDKVIFKDKKLNDNLLIFKNTKKCLDNYFKGLKEDFKSLKIKLEGNNFSLLVWNIVKEIPYGETLTYKDIAIKLNSKAYQAVGRAVGKNPLPIIIPCHRVIGLKNKYNYHYGKEMKQKLLEIEDIKF